jgi:formate dehydrogenase assembly factor FdhD
MPLAECALIASGRGGFEIIQKGAVAGFCQGFRLRALEPCGAARARGGHDVAGFLRASASLQVYAGGERLGLAPRTDSCGSIPSRENSAEWAQILA